MSASISLGSLLAGAIIGTGATLFILRFTATGRMQELKHEFDGDDGCLSLYYDKIPGAEGTGFPERSTCSPETMTAMTTIRPEFKRLAADLYAQAVENLPIFCIDVVCRRKSDGKVLLFYRRDKPAANIWWWPGGRMYRGENFFQAAVRKISEETGSKPDKITPKRVIQVWNTFFPDSSWDDKRRPGYEGTQTVNVCVFCEIDAKDDDEDLFQKDAQDKWAVSAHRWISIEEGLVPGKFDKYVRLNLEIGRKRKLF